MTMEWKIYKNGHLVEEATCIYDASDKVAFIEYPREDYAYLVNCAKKEIIIITERE